VSPHVGIVKPTEGLLPYRYSFGVPKSGQKPLPRGLREVLANSVRALMKAHKLEYPQELGAKAGFSRQKADRILKATQATDIDTLEAIADAFNIDVEKLLQRDKEAELTAPPAGIERHGMRADKKPSAFTRRNTGKRS
jgi:transcriptional regulator with XRE-family HTH domain